MKRISYKLTSSESKAFNAFSEERVLALKSVTPKINLCPEQLEHVRACFFNAIADAYACGLTTKNRKNKPNGIGIRDTLRTIDKVMEDMPKNKTLKLLADRVKVLSKQYSKVRSK